MQRPRGVKDFFYWTGTLLLFLLGSYQLFLSHQYMTSFVCGAHSCNVAWQPVMAAVYGHSDVITHDVGSDVTRGEHGRPDPPMIVTSDAQTANATAAPLRSLSDLIQQGGRPVLVLVLASSPRSGSTFIGELMSSPRESLFLFEPFWYYSKVKRNASRVLSAPSVTNDLYSLLSCRLAAVPPMFARRQHRTFIWRKPRISRRLTVSTADLIGICRERSLRVVKTIRIRLADALPLLTREDLDIHIIHLVRDPRAIMNSLIRGKNMWPETRQNPEHVCMRLRQDLRASRQVKGHARFTQVRYEDVAAEPGTLARRLFSDFLGVKLPAEVGSFIRSHTLRKTNQRQDTSDVITDGRPAAENRETSRSGGSDRQRHKSTAYDPKQEYKQKLMDRSRKLKRLFELRSRSKDTVSSPPSKPAETNLRPRSGTSPLDDVTGGVRPAPNQRTLKFLSLARRELVRQKTRRRKAGDRAVYFSTFRPSGFNELHWIGELSPADRADIERACGDVIEALGYPLVYPQESRDQPSQTNHTTGQDGSRLP